jgi:hypothetical protein
LVFCFEVFQHIPNKDIIFGYIEEASRVLKIEGVLFFQLRTSKPKVDYRIIQFGFIPAIEYTLRRLKKRLFSKWLSKSKRRVIPDFEIKEGWKFSSWSGCSVDPYEVLSLARCLGLKTKNISGLGSQYSFFTFIKTK